MEKVTLAILLLLTSCGLNDIGQYSQSPPTPEDNLSIPELQMDVHLVATDAQGHPLTLKSVHRFVVYSDVPIVELSDGLRFDSITSDDNEWLNASIVFNGFEGCPMTIFSGVSFIDGSPAVRNLCVSVTAFSKSLNDFIVGQEFCSDVTTPQSFEACGTVFTVQFQTTEISH